MDLLLISTAFVTCWTTGVSSLDCVPNTSFPHPDDCSSFYLCDKKSNPNHFTCPEGLQYNPSKKNCDWPENTKCSQLIVLVDYDTKGQSEFREIKNSTEKYMNGEIIEKALNHSENLRVNLTTTKLKNETFTDNENSTIVKEKMENHFKYGISTNNTNVDNLKEGLTKDEHKHPHTMKKELPIQIGKMVKIGKDLGKDLGKSQDFVKKPNETAQSSFITMRKEIDETEKIPGVKLQSKESQSLYEGNIDRLNDTFSEIQPTTENNKTNSTSTLNKKDRRDINSTHNDKLPEVMKHNNHSNNSRKPSIKEVKEEKPETYVLKQNESNKQSQNISITDGSELIPHSNVTKNKGDPYEKPSSIYEYIVSFPNYFFTPGNDTYSDDQGYEDIERMASFDEDSSEIVFIVKNITGITNSTSKDNKALHPTGKFINATNNKNKSTVASKN